MAKLIVREEHIHKEVFDVLTLLTPKLACVWFPVPNGIADLGQSVGGMMKAKGKIKAGVSDFIFMAALNNLACELKSKTGQQSDDQLEFERWCARKGIPYVVCRSLDAVLWQLVDQGFITPIHIRAFLHNPRSPA